jgi:uncharacterized protein with GYD domain
MTVQKNQTLREQQERLASQGSLLKPCCTVDVAEAVAAVGDHGVVARSEAVVVARAEAVVVVVAAAPDSDMVVAGVEHLVWQ